MTHHADERLIPYLRGELAPAEAREVQAHLAGCAACRDTLAELERLAADLARPAAPPIHWGAYRAELREKLAGRGRARPGVLRRWAWPPVPVALAAGLVAMLLYVGLPGGNGRGPTQGDQATVENSILASRLDLISRLELVRRLDLLEDLDVIGGLDRLPLRGEG
ncbi:MAG: hypothetical protein A3K12_03840 [Candidatus Rokubacteria bacterium RIFCSPLOWO2_12_FULL_71_19]|nr:MAG: hypothetical protein A3K12_03840 [Candidatus Rokubacteria bacterium RIFCSPLOWO2_12_FULL_71_19]